MGPRYLAASGAVLSFTAVILGALASHSFSHYLSKEALAAVETAIRYQLVHGVFIAGMGWALQINMNSFAQKLRWPLSILISGVILFSGSIYLLVLNQFKMLGPVTPTGGVLLLIGWAWLAVTSFRR